MAIYVPVALAYEFRGRAAGGSNHAVLVGHLPLPDGFAHRCGGGDRGVVGEAFRRATAGRASAWLGRSGIPALATARPGQAAAAGRVRSPARRPADARAS